MLPRGAQLGVKEERHSILGVDVALPSEGKGRGEGVSGQLEEGGLGGRVDPEVPRVAQHQIAARARAGLRGRERESLHGSRRLISDSSKGLIRELMR